MDANTTTPEPCTTHARRKLHYATRWFDSPGKPGRTCFTLCGADGWDEERANWWLAQWGSARVTVGDLPPCKKCVRKAGLPDPQTEG